MVHIKKTLFIFIIKNSIDYYTNIFSELLCTHDSLLLLRNASDLKLRLHQSNAFQVPFDIFSEQYAFG